LLLHEGGHLLLHWDKLSRPVNVDSNHPVKAAHRTTAIREAEAWWFAFAVYTYAYSRFNVSYILKEEL